MSTNGPTLFDLLPALYRLKDAQLAQSRNLLNATLETAQLQALQALRSPSDDGPATAVGARSLAKASRGPLRSPCSMLIDEQLAVIAEDMAQLYDNQFIETCATWVIPYIGDLIGYQSVHGVAPAVASPRAEVANTISFRRRKGTVLVLEQLALAMSPDGARTRWSSSSCWRTPNT